jgi:hypothetical protein
VAPQKVSVGSRPASPKRVDNLGRGLRREAPAPRSPMPGAAARLAEPVARAAAVARRARTLAPVRESRVGALSRLTGQGERCKWL